MRIPTVLGRLLVVFTLALGLAACGDDDANDASDAGDATDAAEAPVDDISPEDGSEDAAPVSQGGGHATITIGDETWEFDGVRCAVGPAETGRDDTEFVLASTQDGLHLDATINTEFGHSISLNDIEDFENPSVSYGFTDVSAVVSGEITEVIQIDGKDVYAEAGFYDETSDSYEEIPGTLTATCP